MTLRAFMLVSGKSIALWIVEMLEHLTHARPVLHVIFSWSVPIVRLWERILEGLVLPNQVGFLVNCLVLHFDELLVRFLNCRKTLLVNSAAIMILHPGKPKLLLAMGAGVQYSVAFFEKVVRKLLHIHHPFILAMVHRASFLEHWFLHAGCQRVMKVVEKRVNIALRLQQRIRNLLHHINFEPLKFSWV